MKLTRKLLSVALVMMLTACGHGYEGVYQKKPARMRNF